MTRRLCGSVTAAQCCKDTKLPDTECLLHPLKASTPSAYHPPDLKEASIHQQHRWGKCWRGSTPRRSKAQIGSQTGFPRTVLPNCLRFEDNFHISFSQARVPLGLKTFTKISVVVCLSVCFVFFQARRELPCNGTQVKVLSSIKTVHRLVCLPL